MEGTLLDRAVRERLSAGMTDPHQIAQDVIGSVDKHWLCRALTEHAEVFVADYTRYQIRAHRDRADDAPTPPAIPKGQAQLWWVDDAFGWQREDDLTVIMLDAMVAYAEKQAAAFNARADQFRAWASDLRLAGCDTLGQMRQAVAA